MAFTEVVTWLREVGGWLRRKGNATWRRGTGTLMKQNRSAVSPAVIVGSVAGTLPKREWADPPMCRCIASDTRKVIIAAVVEFRGAPIRKTWRCALHHISWRGTYRILCHQAAEGAVLEFEGESDDLSTASS